MSEQDSHSIAVASHHTRTTHPCRQKLAPLLLHMQQQRRELAAAAGAVREWEQYLQSSPLPDPRDRPAMNDFLNTIGSMEDVEAADLHKTLQQCEVSCPHTHRTVR